jgi:phosphoesterase RecJ-like protein
MPGNEEVLIYEQNPDLSNQLIAEATWVYCLDFNALSRINEMGQMIRESGAHIVLIDHHRDPEDFDQERLVSIHASSTCELLHAYFVHVLGSEFINKDVAQCIYTGLITDTGSFRYDSTSSTTIRVAADLLDRGAIPSIIYDHIFDQNRLERLRLTGYFLQNKIELIEEGRVALATLNSEELDKFNVRTGDTEGFVNFGLSIAGVQMSALIIDRTFLIKMSFRSKGTFPCNSFASENFKGGGHLNAAGGSSDLNLDETVQLFKKAISQYREHLL